MDQFGMPSEGATDRVGGVRAGAVGRIPVSVLRGVLGSVADKFVEPVTQRLRLVDVSPVQGGRCQLRCECRDGVYFVGIGQRVEFLGP